MITRCYLEITNVCNLNCLFCPKTDRLKRSLSLSEFQTLTDRLAGRVRFLYFHLMGEPFLHPHLPEFIHIAKEKGFVPVLTTNGTRLANSQQVLEARPYKVQISLHSFEGNARTMPEQYVAQVMEFAQKAAQLGIIVVLRLWNEGGFEFHNNTIIQLLNNYLPHPWTERPDGWRLSENIYLEMDKMFEWPADEHEEILAEEYFCYALRNQVGVLVDGSVVPCCLDHAGSIVLGNLFNQSLEDVLSSPRAQALYEGFSQHKAVEPLCRKCGYAMVTKQYRQTKNKG